MNRSAAALAGLRVAALALDLTIGGLAVTAALVASVVLAIVDAFHGTGHWYGDLVPGVLGVGVAAAAVVEVAFVALWGATPGKLATGVRVRVQGRHSRPGPGPALVRTAVKVGLPAAAYALTSSSWLCVLVALLDGAFALLGPEQRALHDRLARTQAVLRVPIAPRVPAGP